ncbi:thioredoxin fold domain-containing protein [Sulfurimonas sp.]|uniref:thioredoxin fold domain-containing protein n=1 Tax=Sulfurimonas sp. TaxID=2022749 RepID=UPI0035683BEA
MFQIFRYTLIVSLLQLSLHAGDINLDKLINTANKEKKHLLVWLHKTDCGYCERMKEFTINDDDIKSIIKQKFIFADINVYKKKNVKYKDFIGSAKEFAIYMGNDFYPTSLFFDEEGEVVEETVGYVDETAFKKILEYISSKSYKE